MDNLYEQSETGFLRILIMVLILISMLIIFRSSKRKLPTPSPTPSPTPISTISPGKWQRLFYSDFEIEGILDPPEGGVLSAKDWKWYPEGMMNNYAWKNEGFHCIQLTTQASYSGNRALKFHALPQIKGIIEGARCSMALGSGEEQYWANPGKEYLQYYFYILPEFYNFLQKTQPGNHGLFIDIETFDGSYNRAGLIHFDIWGNMARMAQFEHTGLGSKGKREIIARNEFNLKPATWYKVRLEVDHGNNKIIRFSLEGPNVNFKRDMNYEIPRAKQLNPEFKCIFYCVGMNVPPEEGWAHNPTVLIDDIEGGIEVVQE